MSDLKTVQNVFVQWMPMMQCRARRRFLNLPPDLRQEAVANSLALAWKFFYGGLKSQMQFKCIVFPGNAWLLATLSGDAHC